MVSVTLSGSPARYSLENAIGLCGLAVSVGDGRFQPGQLGRLGIACTGLAQQLPGLGLLALLFEGQHGEVLGRRPPLPLGTQLVDPRQGAVVPAKLHVDLGLPQGDRWRQKPGPRHWPSRTPGPRAPGRPEPRLAWQISPRISCSVPPSSAGSVPSSSCRNSARRSARLPRDSPPEGSSMPPRTGTEDRGCLAAEPSASTGGPGSAPGRAPGPRHNAPGPRPAREAAPRPA